MKVNRACRAALPRRDPAARSWAHRRPEALCEAAGLAEPERVCKDPKDGELCLSRAKPEQTLVEARSGSDVQIDRQTWV